MWDTTAWTELSSGNAKVNRRVDSLFTDTRCALRRRLSQMDSAVVDGTVDDEGVDVEVTGCRY